MAKRPLQASTKPMTSTSSSQPSASRGDLTFSREHKKIKGGNVCLHDMNSMLIQ